MSKVILLYCVYQALLTGWRCSLKALCCRTALRLPLMHVLMKLRHERRTESAIHKLVDPRNRSAVLIEREEERILIPVRPDRRLCGTSCVDDCFVLLWIVYEVERGHLHEQSAAELLTRAISKENSEPSYRSS